MKNSLLLVTLAVTLIVMFYFLPAAGAQEIHLDRTWQAGDYAYALVTLTHAGTATYKTACTIKCIAYNAAGDRLGVNNRSFFCFDVGPIEPGFEDTIEIPIELHGARMHHVECTGRCR